MDDRFSRTCRLLGEDAIKKLNASCVAVFGLGGVGGYAVEALARSGVGHLVLVDADDISITNVNRQILALSSTIGRAKVDVAKERVLDINPAIYAETKKIFFTPETEGEFDFSSFDYVVDAIDTVAGKLALVKKCKAAGTPIISCMGAGNKLDATRFKVADIYSTSVCPLARVMRTELKKMGVNSLKVVYSEEKPLSPKQSAAEPLPAGKHTLPASCAFVPPVAGLILAQEVVKDLIAPVICHD